MVALALDNDVLKQCNKFRHDGERVAVVETTWWRTEDSSESVVAVQEGGSF